MPKREIQISRMSTLTDEKKTLETYLRELAHEIYEDKYMLMEYLGPIVNGCRAAFEVSVDRARDPGGLSEDEFQKYIDVAGESFEDVTICFQVIGTKDTLSLVFDSKGVRFVEECVDPNVVIQGDLDVLKEVLNVDSKTSPVDLLGNNIDIRAVNPQDAVIGLGLLCFPSLLRMARTGVDPSSLLAEDADAIIIAAASDLVTKMVRKWIDLQLSQHHIEE